MTVKPNNEGKPALRIAAENILNTKYGSRLTTYDMLLTAYDLGHDDLLLTTHDLLPTYCLPTADHDLLTPDLLLTTHDLFTYVRVGDQRPASDKITTISEIRCFVWRGVTYGG